MQQWDNNIVLLLHEYLSIDIIWFGLCVAEVWPLPSQVTLSMALMMNPSLQTHINEPMVLLQVEFMPHEWAPPHSSTSVVQSAPVQPGSQAEHPATGSHTLPLAQLHTYLHSWPNVPPAQSGEEKGERYALMWRN